MTDLDEVHESYQEGGMNPFFTREPKKSKEFLKKYEESRELAKQLVHIDEKQHLTKTDVDAFFDKVIQARELADQYIPDEESKDWFTSFLKELKEMRDTEDVEDVEDYYQRVMRLESLFMGDYMKHALVHFGGVDLE